VSADTAGSAGGGPESALGRMGIELPPPPSAIASYVPVRVARGFAFVSGQVALVDGTPMYPGHVGGEVTVEEAAEAARRCVLQALSALRAALGTLDRVAGIVQVQVFVASMPGFTAQPAVANGASDLLVEVFGPESGPHARLAVGVSELPLGASVEVALTVELL
jgi:enamine deaminase RidA (YjgF/YER057c/UK114 family)